MTKVNYIICILPEAREWPTLVELIFDSSLRRARGARHSGLYTVYLHFKKNRGRGGRAGILVRVLAPFPQ